LLERNKIVEKVRGAKPNFVLGQDKLTYKSINKDTFLQPDQSNYVKSDEVRLQALEQRKHNFKTSYDQAPTLKEEREAPSRSTNVSVYS
jgi:hypothetical protein